MFDRFRLGLFGLPTCDRLPIVISESLDSLARGFKKKLIKLPAIGRSFKCKGPLHKTAQVVRRLMKSSSRGKERGFGYPYWIEAALSAQEYY